MLGKPKVVTWLLVAATLGALPDGPVRGADPAKPSAPASETNPAVPAAGHSIHGEAFDDGPRQAATLMAGMGKSPFPVTTKSADAQAFVNQGVAQLHSFFYFEAERSFRQAARLDPSCAMAYWGLAMANVNNSRRARGFLLEARKHTAGLSRRETLYLDSLEPLHREAGDDSGKKKAHLAGLETLVQEFPDDSNARAWLAMVAWQVGNIGSRQALDIVLDSVLAAEPEHPGAQHYRIHLWDGARPARAEKAAALYGSKAPGIAHAWHMPGHTYTGLQRYADAAYQQEASARVDHEYMARERVMPFEVHNYAHNNQWLATSLSHVGRARDAIAVARNLADQPREPEKNGPEDGGSAQRSGRLRWAEVLARYELWDDLLAATNSGALDWSDQPLERKERAYCLGLAQAAKGDLAGLDGSIAALKALHAEDAKAKRDDTTSAPMAELEGRKALSQGDIGAAFDRFAKATTMRPEALARAHLAARNFGLAESAARKGVASQVNQVPPLAALVEVLIACGKVKDAQDAYRKLEPLAVHADTDLPVFRRLAPVVASWKAEPGWVPVPAERATDELTSHRVDLSTLGPLAWSPFPAPGLALPDTSGTTWDLAAHRGRNVIILFYLGGKCAHCMQQLQVFGKEYEALKALGTDVVAVSTDDAETTRALKANADGVRFPMPLLADPSLGAFRRFHAHDDFEGKPLHGTWLVDAAGNVRFQKVGAEPFLDAEFLKAEAARVNRLVPNSRK